jgi:TPR repeat protein
MMETGDRSLSLGVACRLIDEKKYTDAFEAFSMLQANSVHDASTYLGYMYQKGLGVAPNDEKAIETYRSGALQGVERAQFYLARLLFSSGQYDEAAKWYSTLYDQGNLSAKYWLYILYRDGLGVVRDRGKSRSFLEQAAESGHLYAMRDLSKRYLRGEYGAFGILRGGWMTLHGIYKWAFALANEPKHDKLH